jgi:hypothetical protein
MRSGFSSGEGTPQRHWTCVVRWRGVPLPDDSESGERLGQNARRFVATHHRWDDILRRFELIVTGGIEREAPRTPISAAVLTGTPLPVGVASS